MMFETFAQFLFQELIVMYVAKTSGTVFFYWHNNDARLWRNIDA